MSMELDIKKEEERKRRQEQMINGTYR